MIASLRGTVLEARPGRVVLDVGGVGYLLAATASAARAASEARRAGAPAQVQTHLHVREDALQLFGFASADERELFELLLGVSGVGPKAALAIVSGYAPEQLRRAVATGDEALFTSIPGIGRKTAQRVVIDLRDKLAAAGAERTVAAPVGPRADDPHLAARDALIALGLSVAEAETALRDVPVALPVDERVRRALVPAAEVA